MKVTQNGTTWIYTQHPVCEVCGHKLDFVPVLLEKGLKVCPACSDVEVEEYFHPHTLAFGECACTLTGALCKEFVETVCALVGETDEWKRKHLLYKAYLHHYRARHHETVQHIYADLVEEFRHWLTVEQPTVETALANIGHVVNVARFMTQGYADATALEEKLREITEEVTAWRSTK